MLQRYRFLKNYKITSFSNDFDTCPALWLETLDIIDANVNQIIKLKNGN